MRLKFELSTEVIRQLEELQARYNTPADRIRSLLKDLQELEARRELDRERDKPITLLVGDSRISNRAAIEAEVRLAALQEIRPLLDEIENLRAELLRRGRKGTADRISVFICHAGEDKDDLGRPLAQELERLDFEVWFDEYSTTLGDSIREKVEEGLRTCDFGLVLLSPTFLSKPWPRYELDGLLARELGENRKIILPVLHGVSEADIRKVYPGLSGKVCASTAGGLGTVLNSIVKALSLIDDAHAPARPGREGDSV